MHCFKHWLSYRCTELRRLGAMELYKMQSNLLCNIMDKAGLFVHKDANQIGKTETIICGKISTCFQCLAYLLRLHVAMARLVENEAEHIGTGIYGNTYMFRCA